MARKLGILASLCVIAGVWIFVDDSTVSPQKDIQFHRMDLGNIGQLDDYQAEFAISNNTSEAIRIDSIDSSCDCVTSIPSGPIVLEAHSRYSVPYSIKITNTKYFDLGSDFRIDIGVFVYYRKTDNVKRGTSSAITGTVSKIIGFSDASLFITNLITSKNPLAIHGNTLTVKVTNNYHLTIENENKMITIFHKASGGTHTIKLAPGPELSGDINDRLLCTCHDENGKLVARKTISVRGIIFKYLVFPSSYVATQSLSQVEYEIACVGIGNSIDKISSIKVNDEKVEFTVRRISGAIVHATISIKGGDLRNGCNDVIINVIGKDNLMHQVHSTIIYGV